MSVINNAFQMAKAHPLWVLGGLVFLLLLIQFFWNSDDNGTATTGVPLSALQPDSSIIAANNALEAQKAQSNAAVAIAQYTSAADIAKAQYASDAAKFIAGVQGVSLDKQTETQRVLGLAKFDADATMGAEVAISNLFGFSNLGQNVDGGGGNGGGSRDKTTISGGYTITGPSYQYTGNQLGALYQNALAALAALGGKAGAAGSAVAPVKETNYSEQAKLQGVNAYFAGSPAPLL